MLEALAGGVSGERSVATVTQHLQHLLGSTEGYAAVLGDYGLSAEASLGAPGAEAEDKLPEERLRAELLRNLLKFEPALREAELSICSRDARGRLYFLLSAGLFRSEPRFTWGIRFNVWSRQILVEELAT